MFLKTCWSSNNNFVWLEGASVQATTTGPGRERGALAYSGNFTDRKSFFLKQQIFEVNDNQTINGVYNFVF